MDRKKQAFAADFQRFINASAFLLCQLMSTGPGAQWISAEVKQQVIDATLQWLRHLLEK